MVVAGPALLRRVRRVLEATPILDIHTHLYDPGFRSLLSWGIDDLLVYHYLVSESFRHLDVPYEVFFAASKAQQADLIWKALFVAHSPVSEACRGVITVLNSLGISPRKHDLASLRRWFAAQNVDDHVERVLRLANLRGIGMTNSPFDHEERPYWEASTRRDPRFFAALRIDPLLMDWPTAIVSLQQWGYAVTADRTTKTTDAVRRFLADWTRRIGAQYCMVSLPPAFAFPASTEAAWLIENAVLPHCREFGQPFALMLGVKRQVNPALRMAGDGVGRSDLGSLENLCARFPENRFAVTALAREAQHELVVLARKFRNLHPFGCWWFTNTPQLVREITSQRLELLGTSFTPQHSDARVLEQLIYKWRHSREWLAESLAARYQDLAASGWEVTDAEMERDARELLGGAFEQFCGRSLRP